MRLTKQNCLATLKYKYKYPKNSKNHKYKFTSKNTIINYNIVKEPIFKRNKKVRNLRTFLLFNKCDNINLLHYHHH